MSEKREVKHYSISFKGRERNAIGSYQNYSFSCMAFDDGDFMNQLYQKYQDIQKPILQVNGFTKDFDSILWF